MSLDGFVAGPNQSEKDPLGIEGMQLHQWLLPLKAFRERHGEEGDPPSPRPAAHSRSGTAGRQSNLPELGSDRALLSSCEGRTRGVGTWKAR
jgi:hypothetical protein